MKILLLGGTGAMGVYLTKALLDKGHKVDVVSLDKRESSDPRLRYFQCEDAMSLSYLRPLLSSGYDVVVDYLIWDDDALPMFGEAMRLFCENAGHYIFHSSYRVYADEEHPIRETSPRLLDVSKDPVFLAAENEYSLYKARAEDMLRASGYRNYTILRPSITFSERRFQLTVLEAYVLIYRIRSGRTVILPEEAMDKYACFTWAGDTAKMVAPLCGNPQAFGETYTVSASESMTWREIAELYRSITGMEYITVDTESFLSVIAPGNIRVRWQLLHDRCVDRLVDNTKILKAAGLSRDELTPLATSLRYEYERLPSDCFSEASPVSERMDAYLAERKS